MITTLTVPTVGSVHPAAESKIGLNTSQPCSRSDWFQLQKLLASDGSGGNEFGHSVSVSGDTALIGALGYLGKGAAYVFTYSGSSWTQQAKLTALDGQAGDLFGCSVSVSGGTALIGAPGRDSYKGAAYVFTRSGSNWTQQAKLTASDGAVNDYFGGSVSMAGDTALIGSPWNSDNGSAYVFTRSGSNWTLQAKVTGPDSAFNVDFGWSVFVSGDTALIGGPGCYSGTGGAWMFTRSGSSWKLQANLFASDGAAGDEFGKSVFVSGDTALIGAYRRGYYTGAAYVFTYSGSSWTQQAKLTASDGQAGDDFGYSVSVSGDTALIGAYRRGYYTGAAYVFIRSGSNWTQQAKLTASDGAVNDWFGYSVFVSGDTALIGAYGCDSYTGAAYMFIHEQQPTTPIILGSTTGKAKQPYNYTFNSTDPNGDNVSYYIDWGDNNTSSWIGPYASGTLLIQSHSWAKKGSYTIKAKAKDTYGKESDWGTLMVTMPLAYEPLYHPLLKWLLERFPHAFQILRHLMGP